MKDKPKAVRGDVFSLDMAKLRRTAHLSSTSGHSTAASVWSFDNPLFRGLPLQERSALKAKLCIDAVAFDRLELEAARVAATWLLEGRQSSLSAELTETSKSCIHSIDLLSGLSAEDTRIFLRLIGLENDNADIALDLFTKSTKERLSFLFKAESHGYKGLASRSGEAVQRLIANWDEITKERPRKLTKRFGCFQFYRLLFENIEIRELPSLFRNDSADSDISKFKTECLAEEIWKDALERRYRTWLRSASAK